MKAPLAPGRPRDPELDTAILAAAREHLAMYGYEAMSVVAVAAAAGTTRQAVYRRWPSKADLATAAIAGMSRADERGPTDDPYADLLAELRAFRDGVTRPHGVSLVGTMLQSSVDRELLTFFRRRVVEPRRRRLAAILRRAAQRGLIDRDADFRYLAAACTGTLYSMWLADGRVDRRWPERTAGLVWRAAGGSVVGPVRFEPTPAMSRRAAELRR